MAISAPTRYVTMTPGPARRIVTLLPRNSPTPMAPPMASMVSWRCVSLRRSSSVSGGLAVDPSPADFGECAGRGSEISPMPGQITQDVTEALNFIRCVVVDERGADDATVLAQAQALHQPRGVHVAVANADPGAGHGLCDACRRNVWQIETECRHTLVDVSLCG